MSEPEPDPTPGPSGYSDRDDVYTSEDEVGGPFVVPTKQRPLWTFSQSMIDSLKLQIKDLLLQIDTTINLSNIDAVIAQKMTEIDFNPNDTLANQYKKLTELKKKLEVLQKKGGKRQKSKRQKSKRYRKSKKQRKTKTKRRLRRSYKYK